MNLEERKNANVNVAIERLGQDLVEREMESNMKI